MSSDWEALSWSERELGRALIELGRASGLQPNAATILPACHAAASGESAVDDWLLSAAECAGIEALRIECRYVEVAPMLRRCGPAIVRIRLAQSRRYLAIVGARHRTLRLITPSLGRAGIPVAALAAQLLGELERAPLAGIDAWLAGARIPLARSGRARRELLSLILAEHRLRDVWVLRLDPGASFSAQLRRSGVSARASAAIACSLAQVALVSVGWLILGRAALSGGIAVGWLVAWLLAGASALPFQIGLHWLGARAVTDAGALLKQRLLVGALRLPPDRIRTQGSGRLLAMVSESEALETAGLGGAVGSVLALVQLLAAAIVIVLGAGGLFQLALLLGWCAFVAMRALRHRQSRREWTRLRFALGNSYVENAIGNRTRIAQQPRARWHEREDGSLRAYLEASRALDAQQLWLSVLPARGWFVLGFLGLIPALLLRHSPAADLAIAIGGSLQAYAALAALSGQLQAVTSALVAWEQVGELYRAAAVLPIPGNPALALQAHGGDSDALAADAVVLDVQGLGFRYRANAEPVLSDCTLVLRRGDRVLLEGASGGGKSTFASLLVGLRDAGRGYILLRGLDRTTLGAAAWRRRVASAPQFHENHVLGATLAFNLLLGRAWPPSDKDQREAEELCRELGLGPLIDKMPSGLNQIVGESGWQLSHGERSRVFLARALLQRPDVLILDESFGALDPHTLRTCMRAVFGRATTLIVIAHP
jgi:ATP-binding cassette subfamily B protein